MDWRRLLLWIAFLAILGTAVLLIIRVAKIAFVGHRSAQTVLLESRA